MLIWMLTWWSANAEEERAGGRREALSPQHERRALALPRVDVPHDLVEVLVVDERPDLLAGRVGVRVSVVEVLVVDELMSTPTC